jgi:hypothetical protein
MPAGRGVAPLANVTYRQRRDCPPELVVRREYCPAARFLGDLANRIAAADPGAAAG